ncbi:MAG TPA: zf-HC2 domain-containing protein [Candidatus Tectomicrobia bacterium]
MDCRTVHDQLSSYLDHDVPLPIRPRLDQHFQSCPTCRQELAQLHKSIAWLRDFPLIEPSPMFLQHVRERVEHLPPRSRLPFFRRLSGVIPLQFAAALAVVVSAALLWQVTPHLWWGPTEEVAPPPRIEPWSSREPRVTPVLDVPPFEAPLEESFPMPAPLVQAPSRRPGFLAREEFVRYGRELPVLPHFTGMPAEGRVGTVALFPSLTLRAADPIQAAQQIWELVPRTGGELLQSQGMLTPADRALRGTVRLTLSIAANHYQALLDTIRQLPETTLTEERMTVIGAEGSLGSSGAPRYIDHAPATTTPQLTLVITILRR